MKLLPYIYQSGKEMLAQLDPDHFITSKKRVVSKLIAEKVWVNPVVAVYSTEFLELSDKEYAELTDSWVRWQEYLGSDVEKHLAGKHDQKTHGRGGGGVHDAPARMAFWNRSTNASKAKASVTADLAARMGKAGVSDEQFGSAFEELVRSPNALLGRTIAPVVTEYKGYKFANEVTLLIQSDPINGNTTSATSLLGNLQSYPELATEAGIDFNDRLTEVTYEQTNRFVDLLNAKLSTSEGSARLAVGDSEAGKKMISEAVSSTLVANWAGTSNDSSPYSLAIQARAKKLFGLEGTAGWDATDEVKDGVRRVVSRQAPLIDAFLTSQYEATQADFKKQGIKEVTLWRGVALDNSDNLSSVSLFKASHQSRPLTSWSTDIGTATIFARSQSYQNGKFGVVIKHVYPVERVLGTPFTGVGCLAEKEFVLLGGEDRVTGIFHEYSSELMDD